MEETSYADWFVAAKKAVDESLKDQTHEEIQKVFSLSKEVYDEGSKAVISMAAKVEAIGKILIAMAQRISGGARDLDESPFGQVVGRALQELDALHEIPAK